MPLFRPKPIELRLAFKENLADICEWCDSDTVELGMYYAEDGSEYTPDEVEMYYEEIE